MDQHKTTDSLVTYKRLSANDDYYNIVFKKTERIAAAVFYILSHMPTKETAHIHHEHLSQSALSLHAVALESLNYYEHEAVDRLYVVQHALVSLASGLSLAVGARFLSGDIVESVTDEVDTVLRYLRHHYVQTSIGSSSKSHTPTREQHPTPVRPRRNRVLIPKNDMSSDAIMVYSQLSDRTTRIKTVLEAKPEATIKDLTDIITDVSAKTIQRDLNSLIDSGEVIRQGERRWSKYSLA